MRNKRPTYGYLTPYIWGDLSLNYLKGAIRGAISHDANLVCVIGQTPNDKENNNDSANIAYDLVDKRLKDGLVIWASHIGQFITEAELVDFYNKFTGIPMVAITGNAPSSPSILMDNKSGIITLMEHLVYVHDLKKIAYIRGPKYHLSASERYEGYRAGLKKFGIDFDPRLVSEPGAITEKNGNAVVSYWLDDCNLVPGKDIEAIVCVSDGVALGAMKELTMRGYRVPDDIAVVGFNNKSESKMSIPAMTTIDPQLFTYGQLAIDTLVKKRHGEDVSDKIYVENRLVIRGSCGCIDSSTSHNITELDKGKHGLFSRDAIDNLVERIKAVSYQAIHVLDDELMDWEHKLITSFINSLVDIDNDDFSEYLDLLLIRLETMESEAIEHFNDVISELRKEILPNLSSYDLLLRATSLLDQARTQIYAASQFVNANFQARIDKLLISLHATNQTLMSSYVYSELSAVINALLIRLDIPSCFIALFNDQNDLLKEAKMIFAFRDNEMLPVDEEVLFDPKDLIPDLYWPPERRYTLILHPLYYQDVILGYAVFEPGPLDKSVYQVLCSEISTAIHRSMLFAELKSSEEARGELLKNLSDKNVELEARIEERTADIREVNEQLQVAILDANAANISKSRFLANISHEIRTPLNCIIGFAEILQNPDDTSQINNYISLILDESEKLMELINQILDISKIESGKVTLNNEPFNLEDLISSLTSVFSATARNKGLEYYCYINSDVPTMLVGDMVRLRQVLVNLIGNAIKFTEKGKVTISVEKSSESKDQLGLLFKISDTGVGIPKDRQEAIFEVFVQAEDFMARSYGGTGLGTSISKQLVQLMDGEIGLESEVGQGSTFWFTALFDHVPSDFLIEEDDEEPYDLSVLISQFKGLRVLLAEDYPFNQMIVLEHLNELGVVVDVAEDGQEAIDMFTGHHYDLVLMDIQMPNVDGLEATREIRRLPGGQQVLIIGLTAHAYEDNIAVYHQAGMDEVITKPFRKHALISRVAHCLGGRSGKNETKSTADKPSLDAIDFQLLLGEFDGDYEFVTNLIQKFVSSSTQQCQLLAEAVEKQDYAAISVIAHRLKGSSLNLSAPKLAELTTSIESDVKKRDLAAIKEKYAAVVEELERIGNYINSGYHGQYER